MNRAELLTQYNKRAFFRTIKRIAKWVLKPRSSYSYYKDKKDLLESKLFDEQYYLNQNPDLYTNTPDLVHHFLTFGFRELRSPSTHFDIRFYISQHPELRNSSINPVLHYYREGKQRGFVCLPNGSSKKKDTKRELILKDIHNKDWNMESKRVSPEDIDLVLQSGLFDKSYYLELYPEVSDAGIDPIVHYLRYGWTIGCEISRIYNIFRYLEMYSDIRRARINPLLHYLRSGKEEGRKLCLKDFEYPVSSVKADKKNNRKGQVLAYNQKRLQRGPSDKVVYTYGIRDDSWLFYFGINPEWDYICYVDHPNEIIDNSIWEYRISDYYNLDTGKNADYFKTHPHLYLSSYKQTLWLDPNIQYCGTDLNRISDLPQNQICFYTLAPIDKGGYSTELLQVLYEETPSEMQWIKADSRILLHNGFDASLKYFDEFNWYARSKYPQLSSFFDVHYCVYKDKQYSELASVSDLLVTKNQNSNEKEPLVADYLESSSLDLNSCKKDLSQLNINIVIPVFNALDDVKVCLNSVISQTGLNYRLIIADDGSGEETRIWLKEFSKGQERVRLILNKENLGYTENVNNAVKSSKADFTVVLNSDTIVAPKWLEKLLYCAYSNPEIGIVGPLSNAAGWQTVPDVRKINPLPEGYSVAFINQFLEKHHTGSYPLADIINGFCYGIKNEVFDKIGYFDDTLFPKGYGEEDDLTLRARKGGYLCAISTDTYVFHSKSKSFGHSQRLELASASRKILDNKYGKENLLNLTESLRHQPVLQYYKQLIKSLYESNESVRNELNEKVQFLPLDMKLEYKIKGSIAVHLHLFYTDMADFFCQYLNRIPFSFDLFVSCCDSDSIENLKSRFLTLSTINECYVELVENRGRDIAPMLIHFGKRLKKYDLLLHIHSKRSIHDWRKGDEWLRYMLNGVLASPEYVHNLLGFLSSQDNVGITAPPVPEHVFPFYTWRNNYIKAVEVMEKLGLNTELLKSDLFFPAGTFFWCKPKALQLLWDDNIILEDFPEEPIPTDGTIAHALERLFYHISLGCGFESIRTSPDKKITDDKINQKHYEKNYIGYKDVFNFITEAVRNKQPFAMIRYYDGEGAFYNIHTREQNYADLRMKYYFGDYPYTKEDLEYISSAITWSIGDADIIGTVPPDILMGTKEFMENEVGEDFGKLPFLRKRYNDAMDCDGVWRVLSAFDMTMKHKASHAKLCTKDIHYELVYSGLIYKLLKELKEVYLITSQPVKEVMDQILPIKVHEIKIPQRALDNDSEDNTGHYPDVFNQVQEQLSKDLSGRVFLVGAGPLGKIYCSRIKKQGGIALDMGAVLDSWVNFHTRPEHRKNSDGIEINNRLLLSRSNVFEYLNEPDCFTNIPDSRINTFLLKNYTEKRKAK